ncbi:hypothetical protein CA54_09190 [Symmachiella macrocystis]|uniref:Uncharacterized protein n=1 Tax=Symmachiella macrocystis TaxID=2527985 RepID=A0A5C6BKQ4_9PLAN|nr:hypothetical protein CA54_09190 [Symmachiella macrocystis]
MQVSHLHHIKRDDGLLIDEMNLSHSCSPETDISIVLALYGSNNFLL